jgi:hypothetical protein
MRRCTYIDFSNAIFGFSQDPHGSFIQIGRADFFLPCCISVVKLERPRATHVHGKPTTLCIAPSPPGHSTALLLEACSRAPRASRTHGSGRPDASPWRHPSISIHGTSLKCLGMLPVQGAVHDSERKGRGNYFEVALTRCFCENTPHIRKDLLISRLARDSQFLFPLQQGSP